MKDDLGLSALVRTAHEYAKQKAASRKEWAVSIASARALNAALDSLAIAAENYARAAAKVFAVEPPAAQTCSHCGAPLVYCGGEWRPPPLQTLTPEQLAHHHRPITEEQMAAALDQGRKDRDALEAASPTLPGRFRGSFAADGPSAAPQAPPEAVEVPEAEMAVYEPDLDTAEDELVDR